MAGAGPEEPVRWPLVYQRWWDLTFLHWPYPPSLVQRLLPPGLTVHTHAGQAWVSLAAFTVRDFRPPMLPALPWLSSFPETNVRTYVVGDDGLDGLWFFSLDVSRLLSALGPRLALALPYFWADMTVTAQGRQRIVYRSRRRYPPGPGHHIAVEPLRPLEPDELTERDHFLTGRWRAYTRYAGQLLMIPVDHQPWPLWQARVHRLDQDLIAAAGLPTPSGEPIVHFSPRVDARFGPPRPAAQPSRTTLASRASSS